VQDNPGFSAKGGAGIQAAQFVSDQKADYVVAGNFGPKAASVLLASNIKMIQAQDNVKDAVEKVISGELQPVKESTAQEHFGMRGRGGYGHRRGGGRQ
jgi:predicted Fe-Mo cluster-binding NifX family protein